MLVEIQVLYEKGSHTLSQTHVVNVRHIDFNQQMLVAGKYILTGFFYAFFKREFKKIIKKKQGISDEPIPC